MGEFLSYCEMSDWILWILPIGETVPYKIYPPCIGHSICWGFCFFSFPSCFVLSIEAGLRRAAAVPAATAALVVTTAGSCGKLLLLLLLQLLFLFSFRIEVGVDRTGH